VILQNYSDFGWTSYLSLVGIDRTWAVFLQDVVERDGATTTLTVVDVVTGRTTVASPYNRDKYPLPAAGGFAVTDDGVLAWTGPRTLYALVETDTIMVLDHGATIADLHAEGDAIAWTHDGEPRRLVP